MFNEPEQNMSIAECCWQNWNRTNV